MEKICFKPHYCSLTTLMFAFVFLSWLLIVSSSLPIIDGASQKPNLGVTPILPIKPKPFMPSGMGMDSNTHNLFITEFQNDVVKKFTVNGILVKSWGGLGSFNGKFSDPNDVAVDSKGNVFVTDGYNNRIQKFQLSTVCAVNTIQFTSCVCLVKTWDTYGIVDLRSVWNILVA